MDIAPIAPAPGTPATEHERYGLVRIATERFEIGGYRYDRLADAVAEAKRRNALKPGL